MQRSANSVICADVRFVRRLVLVIEHPALRPAVVIAEVLQEAFTRLVAHRTVERVIDEQRLERLLLGVNGTSAIRHDDGAVLGGSLAGRHDLRLHGDGAVGLPLACLDQAHPATGHDRQRGMPAIVRDEDARLHGRLDQVQLLIADFDGLVVDVDDCHRTYLRSSAACSFAGVIDSMCPSPNTTTWLPLKSGSFS